MGAFDVAKSKQVRGLAVQVGADEGRPCHRQLFTDWGRHPLAAVGWLGKLEQTPG